MDKSNKTFITIKNTELECNEDGTIYRKMKSGKWKEIPNRSNQSKGYNVILIDKKQYMRSQIIAHAFLEYSLDDKTKFIYHLDLNKLNCSKNNLEIKTRLQVAPLLSEAHRNFQI
jgi:hypothetical protein